MTMIPCQFTSPDRKQKNCGRTALCILKKASLTVEAAVVLPVFLLAMTMLLSVIDICRIKIEGQAELTWQAKKLSMYAYATPGIYESEYVDLYKIETYDFPVQLFPFKTIKIALRARMHTWTGRGEEDGINGADNAGTDGMVYITDRETVYHTNEECTHLSLSIIQTDKKAVGSLRNEDGGKYYACEKCCGGNGSGDGTQTEETYGNENHDSSICYVAENGSSYHASLNCSSLTRTTKLVKKTEVGHLVECERCIQDIIKRINN